MVMRKNVEAVVVTQDHRISDGVERCRRELSAGGIRRVVKRAFHSAVHVIKYYLIPDNDTKRGRRNDVFAMPDGSKIYA